ncbi:CoA transferase, partial [Klebsiella pneumoniae]|nr:CoA transferase [Klebsiella pneumoniae]
MAVGAIEPQFYAELLKGLEIDPEGLPMQIDPNGQDQLRKLFAEKFKTKTRDEWAAIFEGTDACTTPVLTLTEATENEHIAARNGLVEIEGVVQHA